MRKNWLNYAGAYPQTRKSKNNITTKTTNQRKVKAVLTKAPEFNDSINREVIISKYSNVALQ